MSASLLQGTSREGAGNGRHSTKQTQAKHIFQGWTISVPFILVKRLGATWSSWLATKVCV